MYRLNGHKPGRGGRSDALFEDKYLNILTPPEPARQFVVDFTVNTQAASSRQTGSGIVFRSKRTLLTSQKNDQIQQKAHRLVEQPAAPTKAESASCNRG